MGKRNLKNKYIKKKNKTEMLVENENVEENQQDETMKIDECYIIIQKLNSTNYTDRESVTSLLAGYEFNTKDEKLNEQFLTKEFCQILAEKLLDPFIQVRYNSVNAIINMMISYSEHEIDNLFLFDTGLFKFIENILSEYLNNRKMEVKLTEGEHMKTNKLLKSVLDLLLLILDLYDCDESKNYNKLDFNLIIGCCVQFILSPEAITEEVVINSCVFINNLLSLKVIPIEEGNNLKNYVEFAEKIVKDKVTSSKANSLVVACFTCSLFYIYCSNTSSENQSHFEFIQFLIDAIYSNINFTLCEQIENLNLSIQNYIKNTVNEEEGMVVESQGEKEKDANKANSDLKNKSKVVEENIRATILYLKTFTDVINSVELKNKNENKDVDEMDEEFEEIEIEEESLLNSDLDIEKRIAYVVNTLFSNSNYAPLLKMLKFEFLPKLIKFFDNLTIEEFLIHDFDKMIVIKELLYDLEYYTLSIINNIIQNFEEIFNDEMEMLSFISLSIVKRLHIEEYSHNQDFLSVLLTTFRTILEKYKNISEKILLSSNNNFDFKSLFVILNNNISDSFIKINIIDIIAFLFSFPGHSKEDNNEICKMLYNFCLNESDMEVSAHVLNAYFDIYKEDDYDSNFILKSNGVIELMKMGLGEFKNRIRSAYKVKEMDKQSYEYAKETLVNMRRFIKYKENLFKSLNL